MTDSSPQDTPPESSPDQPKSVSRPPWFDWTDRDQWVLAMLSLSVLLAVILHWTCWRAQGVAVVDIERLPLRQYEFRIEINQATWVEWMQLPTVGEVLARRIVADRKERGPFHSIEEVSRVPGVGAVTFDTIQPWLTCSDCKTGTAH